MMIGGSLLCHRGGGEIQDGWDGGWIGFQVGLDSGLGMIH